MAESALDALDTPPVETPAPQAGVSDSKDGATGQQAAAQTPPSGEAPKETLATAAPKEGEAPKVDGEVKTETPAEVTWREKLAGTDEKLAKLLSRYPDEQAFARAHLQLVQKMSSGEIKEANPFPENGTDEEKSNWRKANGIPEAPEGYVEKLELPEGIVPGEADIEGVKLYAEFAKQNNWDQKTFNQAVDGYYKLQDQITAQREAMDDQFHAQAEDELRKVWEGPEYRRNVNAMHNLFAGAPDGVRESLFGGRTADGKLIGDHPGVLKWFAQLAYEINPAASVLPAGLGPTGLSSRMQEFESMLRNPESDYYTGANREELRAEYRKLLEAQEKISSRAA